MTSARGWSSTAQATSTSACNVAPAGPTLLCHSSSSRALEREREGGHNDMHRKTKAHKRLHCSVRKGGDVQVGEVKYVLHRNALYIRTALIGKGDDN